MAIFKRFEDIEAWKKARELVNAIYEVTSREPFSKDFVLRDQIRRAAISVMFNIAEGSARKSDRDFSRFLVQSHASAAEIQSALYVAVDQRYISQETFTRLYRATDEISRMVFALSDYLLKSDRVNDNEAEYSVVPNSPIPNSPVTRETL